MSIAHWSNDTRGKTYRSATSPGIELGPPRWESGLSHGTARVSRNHWKMSGLFKHMDFQEICYSAKTGNMNVRMYVCMYVCLYVCMDVCRYVRLH
jgi:hypothetical protein